MCEEFLTETIFITERPHNGFLLIQQPTRTKKKPNNILKKPVGISEMKHTTFRNQMNC